MRLALTLAAKSHWPKVLAAAQVADASMLDAISFWDRYHSRQNDPIISGLSLYGALAVTTQRIRLVPLVLSYLGYTVGRLAKETAMLAIMSDGRFELGIGAGDYPAEQTAWGQPHPDPATRVATLAETVGVLRRIWAGDQVTLTSEHLDLVDASCRPLPTTPPRVVVGAGKSRRMIQSAVMYADELNVYGDDTIIQFARRAIDASGRDIPLSVGDLWVTWPKDARAKLSTWEQYGVQRVFIALWYPFTLLPQLCDLAAMVASE
jgi:alkanesulfonate monooxygenase SsuD/methylene tetrahydromethanopterin reductase-like flavin-dependent oxidoreductase (luciferase family)